MDANKRQRYEKISTELTKLVGGRDNIQGVSHCATRLRIVLKDNDLADLKAMEDVDLVKGVFVAGDQVQVIFGAGLVNDVYEVFADQNNMKNMSLSDLKTVANKKMNPLQRIIKALSDDYAGDSGSSPSYRSFRGFGKPGAGKEQRDPVRHQPAD